MKFSSKTYNVLKWLCLIFIPATGVLLNTLLPVYGVDDGLTKIICTTLLAVQTFIGTLIGISTATYNAEVKNND